MTRLLSTLLIGFAFASAAPLGAQVGAWRDLNTAADWRGYKRDSLPAGWVIDADSGTLTRPRRGCG